MQDFKRRLSTFLAGANESRVYTQLSQDASTREYFRIEWKGRSAIACVYPEQFIAAEHNYIDVTELFLSCGLPVAEILAVDESLGVMILEDLGDRILRAELDISNDSQKNSLIDQAILLIPRIQSTTTKAFDTGSVASKLRFDTEKLLWELDFFKTHYFETLRSTPLSLDSDNGISTEFQQIAAELDRKACVVCHRDFHAANLMLDDTDLLHIIDHQDARIGSITYDLVSLLLDRVTETPSAEWIAEKQRLFLSAREKLDLGSVNLNDFEIEFKLQTIQRCLKAVGTFSYQSSIRGKTYFIPYIEPMFRIVMEALNDLGRFPSLRNTIRDEIRKLNP